jgi:hypothetical protein
MANFFRIRNFERFQHYKDRNPPWIKLYGALWRDRAFFRLPDAFKAHLIGLFALAARLDNRIPDDPEWLAHELCASEPIDFDALLGSGFLIPERSASTPHNSCNPADTCSVSESDLLCTKAGIENHSGSDKPNPSESDLFPITPGEKPSSVQSAEGEQEHQRHRGKRPELKWPAGFALEESMRQFAAHLGIDADAEFEAWRDDCAAHDRRYADWRAAWRGRCRNALRFRSGARRGNTGGLTGESAMEAALRRLREATEREGRES